MRIYLAATHVGLTKADRRELIERGKPKFILTTFFEGPEKCKEALNNVGTDNFLLDSGAFSFMSGAPCTKEIIWEYAERYVDFIIANNVKYYIELDVDTIFGIEFVEQLRAMMEKRTGRQCIPVWHKSRGVDYYKRMVAEYSYIAIGGLVFHVKQSEWGLIRKLVQYAYDRGVKVHGLGFTKVRELDNYKFWSVDSSSWTKGAGRGQQRQDFNGEYIVQHRIDGGGKKVNLSKLILHNGLEWCKYQRLMESKKW